MNGRLRRPLRLLVAALAIHALPQRAAAQEATAELALVETLPLRRALAPRPDSILAVAATPGDSSAVDPAVFPIVRPQAVLLVGGLVSGTAGFLGGAYAGDRVSGCTPGCTDKASLGANIGMTLLIPVGIHLASGGEGSLRNSLLASAGVSVLGALASRHVGKPDVLHMVLPVAQITAVIVTRRIWK
jgi:hypothetical protein